MLNTLITKMWPFSAFAVYWIGSVTTNDWEVIQHWHLLHTLMINPIPAIHGNCCLLSMIHVQLQYMYNDTITINQKV